MKEGTIKNLVWAWLFTLVASSACYAATLDFRESGVSGRFGDLVGSKVVNLSNAVLTSYGADVYIDLSGSVNNRNGTVCAVAADFFCEADWKIDFLIDVFDLTFSSFFAGVGDNVDVMAYLNGALLGSAQVTSDSTLDFSSFGAIDQLFFDDSSSDDGIEFGDFSFANVASVPLPATLPLLLAGIAGLSLMRRRASRSV